MARHERIYDGERFTVKRTLQLTPSQAALLDTAAAESGATWSDLVREILFRRLGEPGMAGGVRRDAEAAAIIRALDAAAYEHNAVGNNVNQIARHLNTTGEFRDHTELRETLTQIQKVSELHCAALAHLLTR